MSQKIAAAVAMLVALAVAGTASAGASKSSSSISSPIVVSAGSAPAGATSVSPQYGDRITFDVSTTATTSAYVNLTCYQSGSMVGAGFASFFAGGAPGTFVLRSPQWSGGAADCTADLGMFSSTNKWKVLASTSFHVNA